MLSAVTALFLTIAVTALLGVSLAGVLMVTAAVFVVALVLARRTVASTLAGVALIVVRPYAAGERVRIQSPDDGCHFDAVIVHIGLANTTLATDAGVLVVPNHRLLRNPPTPAPPSSSAEPCRQGS